MRERNKEILICGSLILLIALMIFGAMELYTRRVDSFSRVKAKAWCASHTIFAVTLEDKGDHWSGIDDDGDKVYVPKNLCVIEWVKEKDK